MLFIALQQIKVKIPDMGAWNELCVLEYFTITNWAYKLVMMSEVFLILSIMRCTALQSQMAGWTMQLSAKYTTHPPFKESSRL